MFNKKQDVEDDFMGYNTNSSETPKEKSGGGLGSIIQFLIVVILLGVIAVGGMFGYKYMQKGAMEQNTDIVQSKPVQQPVEVVQEETPVKSQPKMYTKEQVEQMVQVMMAKIIKESEKKSNNIEEETNDNSLIGALNNIQIDQIDDLATEDLGDTDTNKVVKNNSNDKIDRYNKVTIDNTGSDINDLASQINNTINNLDQTNSKQSQYTQSISNEITTRENEMRVIVVREGDSLSLIAKRAYGNAMDYPILMNANPDLLKNPNRIYVGQRLRAPLIN